MNTLVKNIIRFSLFILVQVFVLDKIHLHQMVTPYLYFLFIIWLPFRYARVSNAEQRQLDLLAQQTGVPS